MEKTSTYTSIGNTNNEALKVQSIVAAFDIKHLTKDVNIQFNNSKYSNKMSLGKTSISAKTNDEEFVR